MTILSLVSAAPFELEPTIKKLKECETEHKIFSCGIGALNAAKCAKELKEKLRGHDVIFVGSCGEFTTELNIRTVVVDQIRWLPPGERLGFAYSIDQIHPTIVNSKLPSWTPMAADRAEALCSSTISLKSESKFKGTVVENLELYSIASEIIEVCHSFLPILAVTNVIGPDSHSEWKQNFQNGAEICADFVYNALKNRDLNHAVEPTRNQRNPENNSVQC